METKQIRKCSQCGEIGHNKRTCRQEPPKKMEGEMKTFENTIKEFVRGHYPSDEETSQKMWDNVEIEAMTDMEDGVIAGVLVSVKYEESWVEPFGTSKKYEAYKNKLEKHLKKSFKDNDIEIYEDDHTHFKNFSVQINLFKDKVENEGLNKEEMNKIEKEIKQILGEGILATKSIEMTSEFNKNKLTIVLGVEQLSKKDEFYIYRERALDSLINKLKNKFDYYITSKLGKDGFRISVCEWK